MINSLVLPSEPRAAFFRQYLKIQGVNVIKESSSKRPNVLHIFSRNPKAILRMYKIFKPDLLVLHQVHYPRIAYNLPYVYFPLKNKEDFYKNIVAYTNNISLTNLYLNKINVQYTIKFFTSEASFKKKVFSIFRKSSKMKTRLRDLKTKLMLD